MQKNQFDSALYWESRYAAHGTSGAGSYNRLAAFKAEVINAFVNEHGIERVVEFGSGDGNQLSLFTFKHYTGFDVSPTVLARTRERFAGDSGKTFLHADDYAGQTAELALSLDVIYHLIEDEVFDAYMRRLFAAAEKYVIIYSSNGNAAFLPEGGHVKHRKFTAWVRARQKGWECIRYIPNRYPLTGPDDSQEHTSFSDFYIFARQAEPGGKSFPEP